MIFGINVTLGQRVWIKDKDKKLLTVVDERKLQKTLDKFGKDVYYIERRRKTKKGDYIYTECRIERKEDDNDKRII